MTDSTLTKPREQRRIEAQARLRKALVELAVVHHDATSEEEAPPPEADGEGAPVAGAFASGRADRSRASAADSSDERRSQ